MAEKLLMLALSPTMEEGVIARWNLAENDQFSAGDVLCEVETDKATMDYEAPTDGVLLKIIAEPGTGAAIGDTIGIIGQAGEDISSLLAELAQPAAARPAQPAASAQPVVSAEPSPAGPGPLAAAATDQIRSSPLARKIAASHQLDLAGIKGSGPAGRIVKADVENALAVKEQQPAVKTLTSPPAAADQVIPLSQTRKVIARRLAEAKFTAPHYYLRVAARMDDLLKSRKNLNQSADLKVSLNAFLLKLAAEALKRHPRVNASWAGDSIIQHGRIDIGLAVALEDGLITPVVRDLANKGIVQIDQELKELIKKAYAGSLMPEEYTGATFTISNLGSYGIEEFTAIINPPAAAILAVGEIKKTALVNDDDTIAIKQVMKLTLSCDHRVIDGAVGADFLTGLRQLLEEPLRALY